MFNFEPIKTLADTSLTDEMREIVTSFVETQKSYTGDLAPEGIFVAHKELAEELGVKHSPFCGVFTVREGDVPCYACAGPDGLGHWNGVDRNGKVREFLYDEEGVAPKPEPEVVRCCAEPKWRGGRCDNCGKWYDEE